MSGDISNFIKEQKLKIFQEKKRLGLGETEHFEEKTCDNETTENNNSKQSIKEHFEENKENLRLNSCVLTTNKNQTLPFIQPLDLNSKQGNVEVTLEEKKQAFVNKVVNSESPFTDRSDESTKCAMLRYGEYSPNNPQLRVTAAPYVGLGEYEQRRNYFLQKQRSEYLKHLAKKNETFKGISKSILSDAKTTHGQSDSVREVFKDFSEKRLIHSVSENSSLLEKSVQTDIQNIKSRLVQYDVNCQNSIGKDIISPHSFGETNYFRQSSCPVDSFRVDQRLTSAQNALLKKDMEKPKSILSNRRTGSPRERLMSELYNNPTHTFMDRFSYQASRSEELERERIKREAYQQELRIQIEEKRKLQQLREEQERRDQDLENRRLEQQLLRMEEERLAEEQRRNRKDEQMRRHSEDLLRRKQELQSRGSYRKHTDSESSVTSCLRTDVVSKSLSHYSPPVSRRNPYSFHGPSTSVFSDPTSRYTSSRLDSYNRRDTLKRMDSLNSYDQPSRYNTFSRFDSLSRIDSLTNRIESMSLKDSFSEGQRRHSATQQDLSLLRKSPRLQRRSSSGRFEDPLPIPVLKAHSPVAKELKNSIPFNSSRHSEAVRRLEDRWQVPAVQKNIVNHSDSGQSRSILTQLGAIRMQLQQEQLRMDESLRKRGIPQSKAVNFH